MSVIIRRITLFPYFESYFEMYACLYFFPIVWWKQNTKRDYFIIWFILFPGFFFFFYRKIYPFPFVLTNEKFDFCYSIWGLSNFLLFNVAIFAYWNIPRHYFLDLLLLFINLEEYMYHPSRYNLILIHF